MFARTRRLFVRTIKIRNTEPRVGQTKNLVYNLSVTPQTSTGHSTGHPRPWSSRPLKQFTHTVPHPGGDTCTTVLCYSRRDRLRGSTGERASSPAKPIRSPTATVTVVPYRVRKRRSAELKVLGNEYTSGEGRRCRKTCRT